MFSGKEILLKLVPGGLGPGPVWKDVSGKMRLGHLDSARPARRTVAAGTTLTITRTSPTASRRNKNDENEKSASLAAHTGPRYCHGNQLSSAGRAGSEELSESDLVLATL